MEQILFAVLTAEELAGKVDVLAARAREAAVYVCAAQGRAAPLPAGCRELTPRRLLGEAWQDLALSLDREEFAGRCTLAALGLLSRAGNCVLCARADALEAAFPAAPQADTIYQWGLAEGPGFVLAEAVRRAPRRCLAVCGGPRTQGWLAESEERADAALRALNAVLAVRCRVPALLERWQKAALWREHAQRFGLRVAALPGAEPEAEAPGPWPWDQFADGRPVLPELRQYYAKDYRLRGRCRRAPFGHAEQFFDTGALPGDTFPVPLTAHLLAWRESDPLKAERWPDLAGAARMDCVRAYLADESVLEACRAVLRRRCEAYNAGETAAPAGPSYPFGVNLCGFIQGDFGLGESCRSMARILEAADIPYTVVDFQGVLNQRYTNEEFAEKISNDFCYQINLFDINGDGYPAFLETVAEDVRAGRYNIGYWAWELPEAVPKTWEAAYGMLDEIWACSEFTAQAIRKTSPVPVYTVPHVIEASADETLTRADFGLPEDQFLFLMMYDVTSVAARKNPQGAVEAFLRAFDKGDQTAGLVIKVNAPRDWEDEEDLLRQWARLPQLYPLLDSYPKPVLNRLLALCDATVSLHRSEGFGLVPAEAMYFGRPAVLTNWSGNTTYMTPDNCCPVPYSIVELTEDHGPYKKGCHWAEPDVDAAAALMKRLATDKTYYDAVAQAGRRTIHGQFSPQALGKLVRGRLEAVREIKKESAT